MKTGLSRTFGCAAVRPVLLVSGECHVFFLVVYGGQGIVILGGIEPMPVKNDSYFRHLKAGEKDYKRSDRGGLFMLVTKTGSKLWRYAYSFDAKQKLLAIGQYPLVSLADARTKRDNAKRLLADGIDPSVERKAERRQARIARSNTFEAVAKDLCRKRS
jgi:hypothetical protein